MPIQPGAPPNRPLPGEPEDGRRAPAGKSGTPVQFMNQPIASPNAGGTVDGGSLAKGALGASQSTPILPPHNITGQPTSINSDSGVSNGRQTPQQQQVFPPFGANNMYAAGAAGAQGVSNS